MAVARKYRYAKRASNKPVVAKQDVDFLLEVPNLGLADGYGQSARSIVKLMGDVCKEEDINMRILNKRNVCGPIVREEEFQEVKNLLIDINQVNHSKFYLRYALPLPRDPNFESDKYGTFTMFETDAVPQSWVSPLNTQDVVVTPTEWGKEVFEKYIKAPVVAIQLPVSKEYYFQRLDNEIANINDDTFRAITVGNYFDPDRKRIIELIEGFANRFNGKNAELVVKSSWLNRASKDAANIESVCKKYDNIILDSRNLSTKELLGLYCTTNIGLFPSQGEGYGLPQIELALLGRPIIFAMNTALITTSKYFPSSVWVDCEKVPSDYSPQKITGNTGNWFKCDMDVFLDRVEEHYKHWARNGNNSNRTLIIDNHRNDILRHYCSHEIIKEKYRMFLLEHIK